MEGFNGRSINAAGGDPSGYIKKRDEPRYDISPSRWWIIDGFLSFFFCSRVLIITITTASPWRESCFSPRYYKGRVKYCRAETKYELSNEGSSGSSNFFFLERKWRDAYRSSWVMWKWCTGSQHNGQRSAVQLIERRCLPISLDSSRVGKEKRNGNSGIYDIAAALLVSS